MSRLDEILRALDGRRPRAVFLDTLPFLGPGGRGRSPRLVVGLAAVAAAGVVGTVMATGAALVWRTRVSTTTAQATTARAVAASETAPAPGRQLVAQAEAAANDRDWPSASRLFERAVALDPTDRQAWNGLGVTRSRGGDRAGAIEALRQALRLAPGDPETSRNLAIVLEREGQLREAIVHYRTFLAGSAERHPERAAVQQRLVELAGPRGATP